LEASSTPPVLPAAFLFAGAAPMPESHVGIAEFR
jgi:hypothetical protein